LVDQLNGFAGEVTRVAREVGTEGRREARQRRAIAVRATDVAASVNAAKPCSRREIGSPGQLTETGPRGTARGSGS
jgi:hypothetical protein